LVRQINAEWYEGRLNGAVGHFPAAFVTIVKPLPAPSQAVPVKVAAQHATGEAVATFDYDSHEPGDLIFKTGATIVLTEKIDADWSVFFLCFFIFKKKLI
jgi:hypothetical protein